ncbi:MAG TPA: GNAT family N-acetyltransferase [Solirubrobacteraceae bacterium]|nr:GNAT family N-acetyltransferase [Solirubrobacteraceae bacterium]
MSAERLDNPVYWALSEAHRELAQIHGRVRRYPDDVAPFFALPPAPTARDWQDAIELVPVGTFAAIVQGDGVAPAPWLLVRAFDVVQMTGERVAGAPAPEAVALGRADVPEMLALVGETDPGPFLKRTIELGRYVGIRREGRLVAMAGERLHLDGWTEISAVCTSAAYRGSGLAWTLIARLVVGIRSRGEQPFLHVLTSNTGAIRLYEALGFQVRRQARIDVLTPEPERRAVRGGASA